MVTVAPAVLYHAYVEIKLANGNGSFAGKVRSAHLRTWRDPRRPGLNDALLTLLFRADEEPDVGGLVWEMHEDDDPASFQVRAGDGSTGYKGRIYSPRSFDPLKVSHLPITFPVDGWVEVA